MYPTCSRWTKIVSFVLSYQTIILLCAPLAPATTPRPIRKTPKSTQERLPARYRDGEVLVRFRDGVSHKEKETIATEQGAKRRKQLEGDSGVEKFELAPGRDAKAAVLDLLLHPQVQFAEPNFLITKEDVTPNDPKFAEQWALRNTGQNNGQFGADINAAAAWTTTTGARSTVIAVVDSGIDFTHPDLANNQWTNRTPGVNGDLHGWDFVTNSGEIEDDQGHGTAVAGIIAAEGNNSLGVAGVMWHASLMSVRVLDNTGIGDVGNAVQAIDYAVAHGAQVINLSWGTTGESLVLKSAIERAIRRNVVVVCSAGNSGQDLEANPYYPASFGLKDLIVVAATDNLDQPASWSNVGVSKVTVGAPGINILTTQRGRGYWNVTGTSAAAPLVTGIAGLLKTLRPAANSSLVVRAISDGARKITSLSAKVASGGIASAAGALAKIHDSPNQSPVLPRPGIGSGGTGPGGSFSTTPPATTTGAPLVNMPNLDELRNAQPQLPKAEAPIQANLPCADCDPLGGGGGGGNYPSGDPNFSTARTQPTNETGQEGVDLGSRNFNWSLPLVNLPGRAGLDVKLTLTYNSLVWTRQGSLMKFNADLGSPGPGFRLGLPILQQKFLNSQTGIYAYMLVTPAGGRVELRQIGTSNIYESQDSSYTYLDATTASAPIVRTTDGTQMTFTQVAINNEFRCSQIKDRNGNFVTATYNSTNGHLLTIKDTADRTLTFVYDGNNNLQAIRQTWSGVTHDWATFIYGQVWVAPAFGGGLVINGPNNNYTTVLQRVTLHDGSYFTFNYNDAFAQVSRINRYAGDTHLLAYTSYDLDTNAGQTECPRFTARREWAENWNNHNEVVTFYSAAADSSWSQMTMPDGTIHKEIFATSGWQTGLTTSTEVWSAGVRKKFTTISWTQDNTSLTYRKNARPFNTLVEDELGNKRRTETIYTSFNLPNPVALPTEVKEYAANTTTVLRRTTTTYFDGGQPYIDRRVLGLIREQIVYNESNQPQSRVWYDYDWNTSDAWAALPQAATQHDATGTAAGRGNLCWIGRWDVTDFDNHTKVLVNFFKYNRTGSMIRREDHYGQGTTISYADAFSDAVNRNTFAYPTTMTDAQGFSSSAQYNYNFGGITRKQDQKGAVQIITYDSVGRRERITDQTTGAYTRWVYASANTFIAAFSTIEAGQGEAFEGTAFDGTGRYRATQIDMPGSVGGFSTVVVGYDVMGRPSTRSNPTEMTALWFNAGDDASGWLWTNQLYDWKGRPTQTTNPDSTTRGNTYVGCGCAGGEQTTKRDEQGRRKRYTKDVLGRLVKVEELNWNETVYSTTTYDYNGRDQITSINHAGQTRSLTYDGYGRPLTRTSPEQGTTTYTHYSNDLLQTITDSRGAVQVLYYNPRHLVTSTTYTVPSGVAATPNVSFEYDGAGNRTSMNDGLGTMSYVYNTISQLTSETRTFTGVPGTYTLTYGYSLGGQLSSITNQWGAQVGYGYDKVGRFTNVSGSGYAGVSSYVSSMAYRAFGPKQMSYSNGRTLTMQYNSRMRPTEWSIPGVLRMQYSYTWEKSGRVEFARNLDDETLDRYYGYDHLGRLTVSRSGNEARIAIGEQVPLVYNGPYSHGYAYDQFGNITSREGWGGSNPVYSASFTNNKMNSMVYDTAGNLTDAGGGWTFTYDATGQQATSAVGSVQNVYDGDRLRGKKTEYNATTYYLRSTALGGQVVAELAPNGSWTRGYVYLGGALLAVQQGGVYWVHQDPIVKSKRLTNSAGSVVSTIELDPWGGETNRSIAETFQPRKFTSYERDAIGSDEAMHRRYNRWWSRFEQPDPYEGSYNLEDPQSFNRYAYVQNDPVTFVDPTGLLPQLCIPFSGADGGVNTQCFGPWDPWSGFVPKENPVPEEPQPQDPPAQQPLPFNTCEEFVNYLVNEATQAVRRMNDLSQSSVGNNISALGFSMMMTARFEYDRHINNRADGFRPALVAGGQGAGVYGHILGVGGATLWGLAGGVVIFAQEAKDLVDYYRASPADRAQHRAELAGNGAAVRVGQHMWNFMSGTTPREPQRLRNSLMSELCN
ncbi:MAG TPA: S8 family serine peptidase [Pyrinomonadaceae bacterium]|nr:S8 family serine peptidase [Pyrinomonadaceae bacterium]